jgi:pheromone shutdown protein TraB
MSTILEMEPDAVAVEALDGSRLLIEFQTGEKKTFDMAGLLDLPVYQKLKNYFEFQKAHIRYGVVYWDDMTDLAPATAYYQGIAS